MIQRITKTLLFLLALVILSGCSSKATVAGKVFYQGRTVIYGSVILLSSDGTARSTAIAPDGSYKVDGVQPGEVKIAVISREPSKGRSVTLGEPSRHGKDGVANAKAMMKDWFPLPHQYEDPEKSGLQLLVSPGKVSHDIDLK